MFGDNMFGYIGSYLSFQEEYYRDILDKAIDYTEQFYGKQFSEKDLKKVLRKKYGVDWDNLPDTLKTEGRKTW